jgi:hypothetical protein
MSALSLREPATADGRIEWFTGDGSERCLVCAFRGTPSFYVGQRGRRTDEGYPERFPVCDEEHGLMWMRRIWNVALDNAMLA